ncbi:MAG TPA: hypothetical protein VHD14_13295 [Pseudolabrys sp.]|nr:hypothetical protein [Pseudolabrys sp.]
MTHQPSLARTRTYTLLFAMQTLAVVIILWSAEPIYHSIMIAPGQQLEELPHSPVALIASVVLFHCAYWFRLNRVPISVRMHNIFLSHVVLFVGRLSFIFGTAFFAAIVFRHYPALRNITSPAHLLLRSLAGIAILFSLYCYSTELDRLGVALRPPHRV